MDETVKKAKELLTPALFFHTDIVVKRAEGIYVEGTDGRRYMDFAAGLATLSLGHCHPRVVAAVKEQVERLIHSGCIFHYPEVGALAEKLREITPNSIEKFFFTNSGAEAVEGAIKLARFYTGRQGIIAFSSSFHGRTMGALSLTASSAKYRKNYHPLLPGVYHAPYPNCYRCPIGKSSSDCSTECFKQILDITSTLVSPEEVACVIIEPVLGEGGYVVPPADYIKKLAEFCEEHGILLIADEVQSGMARTGRWFASEHFDLRPDIMTLAKGIATGFPLGAIGASREIMDSWPAGAHGTTFGGNPVSCSAAIAVIDTITDDNLVEHVSEVGGYAINRLKELQKSRPEIGDVRGLGFMIGIEIIKPGGEPDPARLKEIMKRCEENGLIIVECGKEKNVARLMPPLITTRDEMVSALDIFSEAISG